ncbi:hypothetical protein, partial [Pseudomonas syringae]|uniref:hypothetical protein n=1 Tax=Pseudomonas syringae TaxID=317 RepID=UPI001E513EBD
SGLPMLLAQLRDDEFVAVPPFLKSALVIVAVASYYANFNSVAILTRSLLGSIYLMLSAFSSG